MQSLHFDPNIAYECVQCGKGCFNAWDIIVEPQVSQRLKGHALELRVIQERGAAFARMESGDLKINKGPDNPRCGFLDEDMLCSIHRELGYAEKPLSCQQYPYMLTETPDGVVHVSAAYSCTAVLEQVGPALEASRPNVEDLIRRGGRIHKLGQDILVFGPWHADFAEVQAFEDEAMRQVERYGFPIFSDAIAGLASLLSAQPRPDERVRLEEGLLAHSWVRARTLPESSFSQLRTLQMVLSMGLLKPCLLSDDREVWRKIDEALLGDADLELPDFGWSGPFADLNLWINQGVNTRFDKDIARFQRSLIFRKSHLTMGGLLPGLWLVWTMPSIIKMLTGLWAWKHQREPIQEDFLWGLDRAETRLVGHTYDTIPIYQRVAGQSMAVCAASFQL